MHRLDYECDIEIFTDSRDKHEVDNYSCLASVTQTWNIHVGLKSLFMLSTVILLKYVFDCCHYIREILDITNMCQLDRKVV